MTALRVVHVIESLAPEAGGPPVVALRLASAQRQLGLDATVLTREHPAGDEWIEHWTRSGVLDGVPVAFAGRRVPRVDRAGVSVAQPLQSADVAHVHGVWGHLPWAALAPFTSQESKVSSSFTSV